MAKRDHLHGTTERFWVGQWLNARYCHPIPFWRAVHSKPGTLVGSNEGGSSYRVDEDLYVLAHDGTDYYQFVVPYFFAGRPS